MPSRRQIEAMLGDPNRVLSVVGAFMVAAAQRAFEEQRAPDGEPWLPRYPNQDALAFNVAGALDDLRESDEVKSRRYDRAPVGVDTGALVASITFDVTGERLLVGTNLPYGRKFHEGGSSPQELTQDLIRNMASFVSKRRRAERRRGEEEGTLGPRGGAPPMPEDQLGPIFGLWRRGDTVWVTTSPPRPFVGLTQEDAEDLAQELEALAETY